MKTVILISIRRRSNSVQTEKDKFVSNRQQRMSKYKRHSNQEVNENVEKMDVEITEIKYNEDEENELMNHFKYTIVTKAHNLSRYQNDKEYIVSRKFADFELFNSCFT
jgi:poly-D-alanine transfer protein DltD